MKSFAVLSLRLVFWVHSTASALNFSLVSDGNEYNKYYIRSVTVKKLEK